MFIEGDGLEVKEFGWEGATEKATVFKDGDEVGVIIRRDDSYTARVYPDPAYKEHWIDMGFSTQDGALAGLRGALAVLADKQEEGLF